MATPHVAGVAALIKARYPNMSNAEIAQKIISTADPATGFNPPVGRVNAYKAVQ
jgi:subtilisin family serine protease